MTLVDDLISRFRIKRIIIGLLCGLCLFCLSPAQGILLTESFEEAVPPPGWITFCDEHPEVGWVMSDTSFGELYRAAQAPENGSVISLTRLWLITPPLRPDSRNYITNFLLRCQPSPFYNGGSLRFLVSSYSSNPADFTDTLLTAMLSELDTNDAYTPFSVSLSAYVGDTVYVAFVYEQQNGLATVFLDSVFGPPLCLPVAPSQPQPFDSAIGVGNQSPLTWANGLGTLSIDLYLSQSETAVRNLSSAARVLTNAVVEYYQPPANFIGSRTYFWRVVAHGDVSDTAGPVWRFTSAVGPLAGQYTISPSGDFISFGSAVSTLADAGISGWTDFLVSPGIYDEKVTVPALAGTSESSPLVFRRAVPESTVTITRVNSTDTCAVIFLGADHLTLDGIHVAVSGGSAKHGIVLNPGSSSNTIKNAVITGPGTAVAGSDGIFLRGSDSDGNRFDSVTVRRAVRGFYLDSPAGSVCRNNLIEHCITDSVRCGVYLLRQASCHVRQCSFVVNAGSFEEVDGIFVAATMPGDSVFLHENRISKLTTSGAYAVGIRVKTDSAAAVVRAYNNMICDFRNTGTSQIRALFVTSGQCEFVANSILVNDVAATGAAYSVYLASLGSSGKTILKNNIFSNREASAVAYNLFAFSMTALLESDFNIFHGTGSNYRLGRWGSDCATLSAWQTATGKDGRSLAGDPGFVGTTDLHISATNGLAHQNGAVIPFITGDADGDARLIPPDRGADEYTYDAPAADYALYGFFDLAPSYVESSTVTLPVIVHNRGSAMQRGVPVQLYCNDVLQDEWNLTLMPLELDTVALNWNTGTGDSIYTLRAQCFLDDDAVPANDSLIVSVPVVRPPLSGGFVIGDPEGPYPDFASAIQDLADRGIAEPVTFEIAPGSYTEQIVIPSIPGASETNRVTFRPAASRGVVNISSETGPATIVLNGADFAVLEGLNVSTAGSNYEAIRLTGDADGNLITDVSLSGPSLLISTAVGVHTTGGGNDNNVIRDVTVQGFYYGIRLEGVSANPDCVNLVENCAILSSRTGIRTDFQDSARLVSNTIRTGYDGAAVSCHGIYVNLNNSGHAVRVEGNQLTGGRGAASVCGIYVNSGSGSAMIVNNMIAGWNVGGSDAVYGILAASGQAAVHFNSLWMNDIGGTGNVIAIADTGATAQMVARNNAIQITERTNPAWFYFRSAGNLHSDYSAFGDLSGGNPLVKIGRWGTVDYAALSQWRTATALDSHSIAGNPGFTDSLDLHVQVHVPFLDGKGIAVAEIATDFDKDPRAVPPDIGADEYVFGIYERNILVQWAPPSGEYAAQTEYQIPVYVSNVGWLPQDSVPVLLSYQNVVVAEEFASLLPDETDTLILNWLTPDVDWEQGILLAQAVLSGDQVPDNNAVTADVTVYGSPMTGIYDCGGGNWDFSTPLQAVMHLSLRGVADSVRMNVYPGIYEDSLHFSAIPGAAPERRVVFSGVNSDPAAAVLTNLSGEAVVRLQGTDNLTFEKLSIRAAGTCTTGVILTGGACANIFRDCIISGPDSTNGSTAGIRIKTDGNDSNRVERVAIGGSFMGIVFQGGPSGSQGRGNIVRRSVIRHARYGIYVSRQAGCVIDANDIQPGSPSNIAAACYGVYVTTLGAGGGVTVCGNRIHDFADSSASSSNRAVGVYAAPSTGASVLAYNNFIYGFERIYGLKINAFYLSSGENTILHNSVLLDNTPSTNEIAAVYISTGTSQVIKNNIFVSRETDVASYGVLQMGGSGLVCDGNDIWGESPGFITGRLNGISYPGFTSWQAAGYDLNGMAADPSFHDDKDLHIIDTIATVDGRGVPTGIVMVDIDGETRSNPPDVGADEYSVLPPPPPPQSLTISAENGGVRLIWRRVEEAASYHVYSGLNNDIQSLPENRVGITSDTTFFVALSADSFVVRFFIVSADRRPVPLEFAVPDSASDIPPGAIRRE